jgi:hypothetical protein
VGSVDRISYGQDNQEDVYMFHKPIWWTNFILNATNLRTVHLYVDANKSLSVRDNFRFTTEFPFWLDGCTALSSLSVKISPAPYSTFKPIIVAALQELMVTIAKKKGFQGKMVVATGDGWAL